MTDLIAADPVRVRRAANVMCYNSRPEINRVGAEIRSVTLECRSKFRICATTGIVGAEERTIIAHHMGQTCCHRAS